MIFYFLYIAFLLILVFLVFLINRHIKKFKKYLIQKLDWCIYFYQKHIFWYKDSFYDYDKACDILFVSLNDFIKNWSYSKNNVKNFVNELEKDYWYISQLLWIKINYSSFFSEYKKILDFFDFLVFLRNIFIGIIIFLLLVGGFYVVFLN